LTVYYITLNPPHLKSQPNLVRRSAFLLTKGLDEKKNIIQATDRLLALVDDEENFQKNALIQHTNPLYQ